MLHFRPPAEIPSEDLTMLNEQDQEQFTRLWTDAQSSVLQYIHSVVRDATAAKDLLQSTALVLLRKFDDYDREKPFLPWALGVAKFQILAHRRDHARSRITFDSDLLDRYTDTWAEVAPGLSDEADALQTCIKQLSGRPKDIVRLRYFEDLRSPEIAQRLKLSAGNVRVTLQRVREQLRKCVEQQLNTEGRLS
jgi:RNA polymerase sigma-70 factor (ECF subfamily)